MYLDEIVQMQKRGEAKGITSVCSAHPDVIRDALKILRFPLVEATCNQVNQFGGYTGLRPADFVSYVRGIAEETHFPFEKIILGGDHLGPNVWQDELAESAMDKSKTLIQEYVQAGFTKIHLDCSMRLADDPPGALDVEVIADRAAQLAKVAEELLSGSPQTLHYIIGTEVPVPGGAQEHKAGVEVTTVESTKQTIDVTRQAFRREGLDSAWERVVAVVVQPGVEFGDDFVAEYQPEAAQALSRFIESEPMVYEAHSTDYQPPAALSNLVRDHFAILKVGPGLTFAFREAVFALAMIENEWIAKEARSNIIQVLDRTMLGHPEHWKKYYPGTEDEQALKRKYSLSDRARYYWTRPELQESFARLMNNLGDSKLPYSLLSQFVGKTGLTAKEVIEQKITHVLRDYAAACGEVEASARP